MNAKGSLTLEPTPATQLGPPRRPLALRTASRLVTRPLEGIERGELRLKTAEGERVFGPGGAGEPCATIDVRDEWAFYTSALSGGSLGIAESFVRGEWTSEAPTAVFRLALRNQSLFWGFDRGLSRLATPVAKAAHWLARNTRSGSRRNIAAHYDLGNDLFDAFLDPSLTYSSAVFDSPGQALEEAQFAKYDRLCRKLGLGPDDHVLEIGTGWGGFALHAASRTGCRVTTTTLSREQHDRARERIDAAGLAERVTLVMEDYRDLAGGYDAIVSIEMIEAVGSEYLGNYLAVLSDRLKPHGRAAIQAILTGDSNYEASARHVDFIKRYIFPGGCLPSLAAIAGAMAGNGDLRIVDVEDITPHYAETLRRWRARFDENLEHIFELGYDERFARLWTYYLCYCEAGFEERHTRCQQIVFAKPEAGAVGERAALGQLPAARS